MSGELRLFCGNMIERDVGLQVDDGQYGKFGEKTKVVALDALIILSLLREADVQRILEKELLFFEPNAEFPDIATNVRGNGRFSVVCPPPPANGKRPKMKPY